MPEGDVIWSTARRLHEALAGQVLTRSDFRVPKFATVDLSEQLVTEVVSRGKHLLVRTGDGLTVHTHLKMDGFWRVRAVRPGVRPVESFKLRLILANAEWEAAGYLLGVTEVIPTADEDQVVGHLGPDLLGPDWDPAWPSGCSPAIRTGRSARRCSISGTWRASATSTRPSCCSCAASSRGGRSARSRT